MSTVKIVPTTGRVVLYTLSQYDVEQINRRRTSPQSISERIKEAIWPMGAQAHIGNSVKVGDVFPAILVRPNGDTAEATINIQVFLDGNDTLWVTSAAVSEHGEPGKYHWMLYQIGQAAKVVTVGDVDPGMLGSLAALEPAPCTDKAGT